jgi:predicted metalloendopeptidase
MLVSPTIREAFNELLVENHWMDEETRDVARDKANAMNERIGYPDYILNDSALTGIQYLEYCGRNKANATKKNNYPE